MSGTLTDFNDLHLSEGLDVVKSQILAAIKSQSTAIPVAPEIVVSKISLEKALEEFALIYGQTNIYELRTKKTFRKMAFVGLVTKKIYAQWEEHDERKTITSEAIKSSSNKEGSGEQAKILDRYVYLYPTKNAWDCERREAIPLDALKMAIPNDYVWWLESAGRKEINIENLVFDPEQKFNPETHINMFHGLPLVPVDNIDGCKHSLELLKHLCNHNDAVFDWLCKWLAYPLQNVGAKMDTAVLVHSNVQGSGKSMFFADLLCQIFGRYASVLGQHQLESQYTEWRSNLLYACFEEVLSGNQKYSHTGTLKHMITGKTQRIEKKFVSGWEEANHMNAIFLSNEFQPFPLDPSDRRFAVIWPKRTMPKNLQYACGAEIVADGAACLYRYLLDYPLGDFNEHSKPLSTDAKKRLISYGLSSWDAFFDDWMAGDLPVPFVSCLSVDLWTAYKDFCKLGNEHQITRRKFSLFASQRFSLQREQRYLPGSTLRKQDRTFVVSVPDTDDPKIKWISMHVNKFKKALDSEDNI